MQIDIDFDVFKSLTAMRQSEADSYNAVLRRILKLPDKSGEIARLLVEGTGREVEFDVPAGGVFGLAGSLENGVWFNGTHFPDGTLLRATYKGQTFTAKIENGKWVDQDGIVRNSPSDAASAVCAGTSVNGWRFWHAIRPGEKEWHRLDELR